MSTCVGICARKNFQDLDVEPITPKSTESHTFPLSVSPYLREEKCKSNEKNKDKLKKKRGGWGRGEKREREERKGKDRIHVFLRLLVY